MVSPTVRAVVTTWKEKYLDYEIETGILQSFRPRSPSWKEKYLDYEIETSSRRVRSFGHRGILEKKSISITRLKHVRWSPASHQHYQLEKKSISITRLKQRQADLDITEDLALEKKSISITRLKPVIVAYTWSTKSSLEKKSISITRLKQSWRGCRHRHQSEFLKRKVSRLRDWN